jgi:hypothetical protein
MTIHSRNAHLVKNKHSNAKLEQVQESSSKVAVSMKLTTKELRRSLQNLNQSKNRVKVLRKAGLAIRVDAVVHLNPKISYVI